MLTGRVSIAFVILLATACTHRHQLRSDLAQSRAVLERASEGRRATIRRSDASVEMGLSLRFSGDSVTWQDTIPGVARGARLATVEQISTLHHTRGALEGFGLGALAGASVGIVLGLTTTDPSGDYIVSGPGEGALLFGAVLGLAGGIIGLPIGAIVGSKDVFVSAERRVKSVSVRPVLHNGALGLGLRFVANPR